MTLNSKENKEKTGNRKPKVSVILPTYNRAYLIEKSIQTVLDQTFEDFELLIIDDGSIDNTESIINNINDPRIHYYKSSENNGVSAARNKGIAKARGEFIAFQDSDTEWYPTKLEMHIKAFESAANDVGIIYAMRHKHLPNDEVICRPVKLHAGFILERFLKDCFIGPVSACVKKRCFDQVGGFDEALPTSEECELWIRLAQEFKFEFIDKALHYSKFTQDSLSSDSNLKNRIKANAFILKKHEALFNKYKKIASRRHSNLADLCFLNKDNYQGRKYLYKAIKLNPFKMRNYIFFLSPEYGGKAYSMVTRNYRIIISKRASND